MKVVVCDSTPLIVLGNAGCLSVFKDLFSEIFIPATVYEEVCKKDDNAANSLQNASSWCHVVSVEVPDKIYSFPKFLHQGEVDAIILADHMSADYLIIDDDSAKKYAIETLGIRSVGTLRILVEAKRLGYITDVKSILKTLVENGMWLSESIINIVLEMAGE